MAIAPLSRAQFASFYHASALLKRDLLPQLSSGKESYPTIYLQVALAFARVMEQSRALIRASRGFTEGWVGTEVTVLARELDALRKKVERAQTTTYIFPSHSHPAAIRMLEIIHWVRTSLAGDPGKLVREVSFTAPSGEASPPPPALDDFSVYDKRRVIDVTDPCPGIPVESTNHIRHFIIKRIFDVFTLTHGRDIVFDGGIYPSIEAAVAANTTPRDSETRSEEIRASILEEQKAARFYFNGCSYSSILEAFLAPSHPELRRVPGRITRGTLPNQQVLVSPELASHRNALMRAILRAKFASEPNKSYLLATLDAYLIVHVPADFASHWGPDTANTLGRLLMHIRGECGGIGVVERS